MKMNVATKTSHRTIVHKYTPASRKQTLIKTSDRLKRSRYPVGEMTGINQSGGAFNFLRDEPDLYSRKDLKKAY